MATMYSNPEFLLFTITYSAQNLVFLLWLLVMSVATVTFTVDYVVSVWLTSTEGALNHSYKVVINSISHFQNTFHMRITYHKTSISLDQIWVWAMRNTFLQEDCQVCQLFQQWAEVRPMHIVDIISVEMSPVPCPNLWASDPCNKTCYNNILGLCIETLPEFWNMRCSQ